MWGRPALLHCIQGKNRSPLAAAILINALGELSSGLDRFVLRPAVLADYAYFQAIWSMFSARFERAQRRGIERGDDNSDLDDDDDDEEDEPSVSDA